MKVRLIEKNGMYVAQGKKCGSKKWGHPKTLKTWKGRNTKGRVITWFGQWAREQGHVVASIFGKGPLF